MALSIADVSPQHPALSVGSLKGRLVTLTFDASYPTGGESLSAASLGLSEIFAVDFVGLDVTGATTTFVPQYNAADGTVQLFWTASAASNPLDEITDTTDASAFVVVALVLGV